MSDPASNNSTTDRNNHANDIGRKTLLLPRRRQEPQGEPDLEKSHALNSEHTEGPSNVVPGTGVRLQGPPDRRKPEKDGTSSTNKTSGWRDVYNNYKELDKDWAQSINEDISTLLLFAGLFATVLTAFLVELYGDLQPDNTQLSATILVDISKQLHALSQGQDAAATTVSLTPSIPSSSRVATTALWLLSLILSLGAALFGILVKQWVREYMRWTSIYPLQHALHIRYHRRKSYDEWHVEGTIVIVWTSLVLGLILFFFGLTILSFDINLIIGVVATTIVALVLLAFLITTLMSVFNSDCPYRNPFSSSIFIVFSYGLKRFSPTATLINRWWRRNLQILKRRINRCDSQLDTRNYEGSDEESGSWLKLISDTVKLWDASSHAEGLLWMKDVWSEWDKVLHLSDDVKENVIVRWKILSWLVSHQALPDKETLVVRCFSDLPGPPPPGRNNSYWLQSNHWQAADKKEKPRLQFEYFCHMVVDSAPSIGDLQGFLKDSIWKISFTGDSLRNQNQVSESFYFNSTKALDLYYKIFEIQDTDPSVGRLLLNCISWLTGTIFNKEGQLTFEHIDFDLFAGLLSIYFMLVNTSDPDPGKPDINLYDAYHRMIVNIMSADQPARQRLSDGPDPTTPTVVQCRIEFAGNLLYLSSSAQFSYTQSRRFEVKTIILYITAAVQFLDRWELETPMQQDAKNPEGDNRAGYMPTKVFWALATIVFDTGNPRWEELNKEDEYRKQVKPFITAVQNVLKFETTHDIKWEDGDNPQRCQMTSFLILNHEFIPPEFFKVMKNASEKGVFDLSKMIDSYGGLWFISPFTKEFEWIEADDAYLNFLKMICNSNDTKM